MHLYSTHINDKDSVVLHVAEKMKAVVDNTAEATFKEIFKEQRHEV